MKTVINWLFDYPELKVYQYDSAFKFSLDSILLAEFANIKNDDNKIIDFCTGNAVIPIILQYRYHKKIIGVELQKEIFSLAEKSVKVNQMENYIQLILDNIVHLVNYFPGNNFDVILCNPPYFKYNMTSHVNENEMKRIARHEIYITLEQIISVASFLLKDKGHFYLVHVPDRIDEVFIYANKYKLAVKELQFVHSNINEKPVMILVTLVKGGKLGTKVFSPICIEGLTTYQNIFRR